jgi:hypothetical protein
MIDSFRRHDNLFYRAAKRAWHWVGVAETYQQLRRRRAQPHGTLELRAQLCHFKGLVQKRRFDIQRRHLERQPFVNLAGSYPGSLVVSFRSDHHGAGGTA